MRKRRDYVIEAAEAHSNLNTYQAVIALMEGGLLYGGRESAAGRITKIAKDAAQAELLRFDMAVEMTRRKK